MNFRSLIDTNPALPITTFSVFRFPAQRAWWAFSQMGKKVLNQPSGAVFSKMLGCGKYGFSILPDWLQYAFLAHWPSQNEAQAFFDSPVFEQYRAVSLESFTLQMQPVKVRGTWEGLNPFVGVGSEKSDDLTLKANQPVVVLTRAKIRTNSLIPFWRNVPKTHQAMKQSKGLLLALGVGELPLVQQATVSIWDNVEAVKAFAYQQHYHKEVVKMTRRDNWYKEDLFARFLPVAVAGTWKGQELLCPT